MFMNALTAISKKVVIVNSRYWNRKEPWGSNSTNNLLLLALNLHNIECRFIVMPRPYSNKLHWHVITHYDYTQSSFRFQYRLLTMTTFFEVAVTFKNEKESVETDIGKKKWRGRGGVGGFQQNYIYIEIAKTCLFSPPLRVTSPSFPLTPPHSPSLQSICESIPSRPVSLLCYI